MLSLMVTLRPEGNGQQTLSSEAYHFCGTVMKREKEKALRLGSKDTLMETPSSACPFYCPRSEQPLSSDAYHFCKPGQGKEEKLCI